MFASRCLEKAFFRAAISGWILIRDVRVADGSLPAFPSVFASIGRLTQGQHNKWTVDC